jgi:hypothetical protein
MKVAVIPADEGQDVRIEEVEKISLEFLKDRVGGWVEAVDISLPNEPEVSMYLNEEGKLKGLPYNPRASKLAAGSIRASDYIVGTVVLCGPVDEDGEDTGLAETQTEWLRLL